MKTNNTRRNPSNNHATDSQDSKIKNKNRFVSIHQQTQRQLETSHSNYTKKKKKTRFSIVASD